MSERESPVSALQRLAGLFGLAGLRRRKNVAK